jgi:hypothetical protein
VGFSVIHYLRRCILFLVLFSLYAESKESLHFVRIEGVAEQIIGERILYEVYRRAGMSIIVHSLPGKRAAYEAATGSKDGEMLRIESYGIGRDSLIRIPIPVAYIYTQAFALRGFSFKENEFSTYKTAIVRGVQHTYDITRGSEKVFELTSPSSLMQFLELGRADIVLSTHVNGLYHIKKESRSNIVPVGGSLQSNGLYHYLHEKHRDKVPVIQSVLKEMHQSGELQSMWEAGKETLFSDLE